MNPYKSVYASASDFEWSRKTTKCKYLQSKLDGVEKPTETIQVRSTDRQTRVKFYLPAYEYGN